MSDNKKFTMDKDMLEGLLDKLKDVILGDSKQDIYTETQVCWTKDIRKYFTVNATRTMAVLYI